MKDDRAATTESLSGLGTQLALHFPPSARLVGVLRSSGRDETVRVKIEVAAEELPSLLAQTQLEHDSLLPGTGGLMGPDEGFWDPHAAKALRTGQAHRAGGRALNVGIDESRPELAIVYLVEHGT